MSETQTPTDADRIELANLFKAIAEFGHRVRQRRLAEAGQMGLTLSGERPLVLQDQPLRVEQKKTRRKKKISRKQTDPFHSDGTLKN